jgi:beta-aspartyl-peptidase (threonine type)
VQPGSQAELRKMATLLTAPINLQDKLHQTARIDTLGTVNFIARDRHGDLASAISTSGLGWKYPGRVGDSPLIGAGNYCDNRYGAVGCTGMGELAIRVSTARSLVLYLKMGLSLHEAGLEALRDLQALGSGDGQYMNIVALTPAGEHGGFTTVPGKNYLYQDAGMAAAHLLLRTPLTAS